ncbi:hypothetical protein Q9966_010811 [Columba livia]|nr:hypothetical protein Q9966_010811 [Columba livia]
MGPQIVPQASVQLRPCGGIISHHAKTGTFETSWHTLKKNWEELVLDPPRRKPDIASYGLQNKGMRLKRKQGCDIVSFWKSGIGEYLHSVKWYKFLSGEDCETLWEKSVSVSIQTAWSAVNTNKFQKGITIKTLMFCHSAKTSVEQCYFQCESPDMMGKRKPEP